MGTVQIKLYFLYVTSYVATKCPASARSRKVVEELCVCVRERGYFTYTGVPVSPRSSAKATKRQAILISRPINISLPALPSLPSPSRIPVQYNAGSIDEH